MKKRLTKLQQEFIDERTGKGNVIAFPISVFNSKEYKKWRKNKREAKAWPFWDEQTSALRGSGICS